ncbi:MAG TPA: uroporphyrinogen-III synthase [Pyrinomonadaceae bacterium]|nr:uroporphyrinogen-III synthase [Pyrinomonadaceae bacterium]
MTRPLHNIIIGITEHRYTKEFAGLFERLGAEVYSCPLLEEKPVENRDELRNFIRDVASTRLDMMIFLTGVGAKFLIAEADTLGLKADFLQSLEKTTVVVRGPKPVAALRQFGVRVDVTPKTPTTAGIIEALLGFDLQGRRIGVQLYGTPNPELTVALETHGAAVVPVQVYAYGSVADAGTVRTFVQNILDGHIKVVAFTSAPQVRVLFQIASDIGLAAELEKSLQGRVVVASIGAVTSTALDERGITPVILPKQPKMASLAQAVAEYFEQRTGGL